MVERVIKNLLGNCDRLAAKTTTYISFLPIQLDLKHKYSLPQWGIICVEQIPLVFTLTLPMRRDLFINFRNKLRTNEIFDNNTSITTNDFRDFFWACSCWKLCDLGVWGLIGLVIQVRPRVSIFDISGTLLVRFRELILQI